MNINIRLLRDIMVTIGLVGEGLESGYLTVDVGEESTDTKVNLLDTIEDLQRRVEAEVLSHMGAGVEDSGQATQPMPDNVVVFPAVTPEA